MFEIRQTRALREPLHLGFYSLVIPSFGPYWREVYMNKFVDFVYGCQSAYYRR